MDLNGAAAGNTVALDYNENAAATYVAPAATLSNDGGTRLNGGSLTVSVQDATSSDLLTIRQGNNVTFEAYGQAGEGAVLYYGGVVGTYSGLNSQSLVINFLPQQSVGVTTVSQVQAVLRAIAYSNSSDNPPASRTIDFTIRDGEGVANGGLDTAVISASVTINRADDAPRAVDDTGSVLETDGATPVEVWANDIDPDGGPMSIIAITGTGVTDLGGGVYQLASGALVTITNNAMGISYDPNGAFGYLTDGSSGALNTTALDMFSYTLNGGRSAQVVVTVNGVADANDELRGGDGSDVITGTAEADLFMLDQNAADLGNSDAANGGEGDDGFFMGAGFSGGDRIDGEGGTDDQLGLRGTYDLNITGAMLSNVETIALFSGTDTRFGGPTALTSYTLSTDDDVVRPGARLVVNASALVAGESFTFLGQNEMDGSFIFYGGAGAEDLTGGSGSDGFFFGDGRFDVASDKVDGFAGADDQLGLRGNFGTLNFLADTVTNIDTIALISSAALRFGADTENYNYELVLHDDNLLGTGQLTVNGGGLEANEVMQVDGSAETSGSLRMIGGAADDVLRGGAGDDILCGGLGADTLAGGAGADRFVFGSALDSTVNGRDGIQDFALGDIIDLSRIDANSGTAENDAFSFIGTGAFTGTAGELRVENTVGPIWTISADVDGNGAADFEFILIRVDGAPMTAADFIF
jgi:Ca2+-binding RTX toxin-like protein